MPAQDSRYAQILTLLAKCEIKIKTEETQAGFSMLNLQSCILDNSHKQATIVFHPNGEVSYICHNAACQGISWDKVLAKLEGSDIQNIQVDEKLSGQQSNGMPAIIMVKVVDLKPNRFNKILPPLSPEQIQGLRDRIERDGFRGMIEITPANIVLDGCNRLAIVQALGGFVELPAIVVDIPEEQQEIYIIEKNLHRRQLTPDQISYLRGKVYQCEKKGIGAPSQNQNASRNNGDILTPLNSDENRTREKVAKKFGVSSKTIQRDACFSTAVDKIQEAVPQAARKILAKEKIDDQKPLTKKEVMEIAKKIDQRKSCEEPLPKNEKEILEIIEKEAPIPSKIPAPQNEPLVPESCETPLLEVLGLLEKILDSIHILKGHKDFPHGSLGKLGRLEEEILGIIHVVVEGDTRGNI